MKNRRHWAHVIAKDAAMITIFFPFTILMLLCTKLLKFDNDIMWQVPSVCLLVSVYTVEAGIVVAATNTAELITATLFVLYIVPMFVACIAVIVLVAIGLYVQRVKRIISGG